MITILTTHLPVYRFKLLQYPTPKQSMRVAVRAKRQVKGAGFLRNTDQQESPYQVHTFTDEALKQYQQNLVIEVLSQRPRGFVSLTGPLRLFVAYVFPPLKNHTAAEQKVLAAGGRVWKSTKPDVTDNLNKPVADALQGIIYQNDSQVSRITTEKYYAADGPYLLLEIGSIEKALPLELQFLHP